MCGITGIFDTKSKKLIERSTLHRMNESLYHRGPDEGGLFLDSGIGLGHRRLSIIDIKTGQQPLFNEDKSVVVVFNGEIYNFQELVPELERLGHSFRTKSDTEVIVHAWESWGEQCVEKFRGMFAFALWDANTETLFLARDRLGVKPLYYALLPDNTFIFGSELKSLLAHGDLPRQIDPYAVEEYFALGYIPEPRTIYLSSRKLPPASTLTITRGAPLPSPKKYWDIHFTCNLPISEKEAEEELLNRLRESIHLRLISEVPLGAFLSGGVDSSAVVSLMGQVSSNPVNACSISFSDPSFDESDYAKQVAQRYNTHHFFQRIESEDFDLIDDLVTLYDEPYADSSALPTYRLRQLARRHVTVALSGDGADENFGGYRRYRMHLGEETVRSRLPLSVRRALFGTLGRLYPKADWAPRMFRAKTTFQALTRSSIDAYFHTVSIVRDDIRSQLFSNSHKNELGGYNAVQVFRQHGSRVDHDDPLALIQYIDLHTYLVGDINTKVDRASMAHALEVREPLMDHPLVEWLASLPSTLKIRRGETKFLFKKAMEPYLPYDLMYRPKMGFNVPLANWFRGPLRDRVKKALLGEHILGSGYFNETFLEKIVEQHQNGIRDYSAPIWTLLMFEGFLRKNNFPN